MHQFLITEYNYETISELWASENFPSKPILLSETSTFLSGDLSQFLKVDNDIFLQSKLSVYVS